MGQWRNGPRRWASEYKVIWELQEACREAGSLQHEGFRIFCRATGHFKWICILKRLLSAEGGWLEPESLGWRLETSSVNLGRVSSSSTLIPVCRTNTARTKSLTWWNGKPLDCPPTLKTPFKPSRDWGKLRMEGSKSRIACSALLEGTGQPASRLTEDLAGRAGGKGGLQGPGKRLATFSQPCLLSLTLRQEALLLHPFPQLTESSRKTLLESYFSFLLNSSL